MAPQATAASAVRSDPTGAPACAATADGEPHSGEAVGRATSPGLGPLEVRAEGEGPIHSPAMQTSDQRGVMVVGEEPVPSGSEVLGVPPGRPPNTRARALPILGPRPDMAPVGPGPRR